VNRQFGVADSKYMVLDGLVQPDHVTRRKHVANFAIKMAHVAFIHYSTTDQDRNTIFGSKYAYMDFYTNLTFKVQKGRGVVV